MKTHLRDRVIDLLEDCDSFIDTYADADDGDDGQLVPNRAARLNARIEELLEELETGGRDE